MRLLVSVHLYSQQPFVCLQADDTENAPLLMPQLWCSHHRPAKSSSKMRYIQQSFLTLVITISNCIPQHWCKMLLCAVHVPARVNISTECHVDHFATTKH